MRFIIRFTVAAAVMAAGLAFPAAAMADTPERLSEAAAALKAVQDIPENGEGGIPSELIEKANCIVVVPSLKSAAFGVGGEYGRGFVSCRRGDGWTAPAGVKIEGGSFGFQIGASETEVVMLVMNEKGMERLLKSKFTLGGEATVAAGPVGRSAEAKTDALMTAEILAYSRSRGVFAGVALTGSTLRPDESANEDLYGKELSNREILTGNAPAPAAAEPLMTVLRRL